MNTKKTKQFYTIGDLSKLYGIGVDSIRYYEEKGLLVPRRGQNGYRYYDVNNIWRMNVIVNLRSLGFSVVKIGEYFANHSIESTDNLLGYELDIIDKRKAALEKLEAEVRHQRENIRTAQELNPGEIRILELKPRKVYEIKQNHTTDEDVDLLMQKLVTKSGRGLFFIGNNRIASVVSPDTEGDVYEAIWMFDENGDKEIEGGRYLSVCYHGLPNSRYYVQVLTEYAKEHKIKIKGPFFDIIWIDIHSSSDREEHIFEVQVLIE